MHFRSLGSAHDFGDLGLNHCGFGVDHSPEFLGLSCNLFGLLFAGGRSFGGHLDGFRLCPAFFQNHLGLGFGQFSLSFCGLLLLLTGELELGGDIRPLDRFSHLGRHINVAGQAKEQ